MKGIFVLVAVFALAAAEEGKVAKRGSSSGYAYAAPAPVAAPIQYAAPALQYAPMAYAAPALAYGGPALAYGGYAAPALAYGGYAAPAVAAAPAYGAPAVAAAPAFKTSGPQGYSQQVPAAAIRNVETVGVTKTITPVVTKTTTYNTHSEPALSVGHVQGYSQHSAAPGKIAPVQFNTQYTQYLNPTVGVNGPVTYSGPAVGAAGYALSAGPGVAVAAGPAVGYAGQAIGYGGYGLAAAPAYYAAPAPAFYAAPAPAYYAQPAPAVVTSTQTYAAPSVTYGAPAAAPAPPAKGGY